MWRHRHPRGGLLAWAVVFVAAFAIADAIFRSFGELFREPDRQLGFIWHQATMGMLLSIPLFLAGIAFVIYVLRQRPVRSP